MCLATNHRRSISPSSSALGELCDAVRDGKAEETLALAKSGTEGIRFENLNDPSIDQAIRACFDSLTADSPNSALPPLVIFESFVPTTKVIMVSRIGTEGRITYFLPSSIPVR